MANYKKAPKLYHIGKKDGDKKNFIKIPQDLMESIFNQLNGRQGNVIKVILFLIGTAGDGSFGISERWICDSTGMLKSCYIEARKTLVELGWVEVIAGRINVNFDKIRNTNRLCDTTQKEAEVVLNKEWVVLNDETGCVNPENGSCDTNCNREEQIINKEITIEDTVNQTNSNTEIKISRMGELEYILKRHNIDEEDIKNIIRDNNIDDVTDFICFLYYMTKKDDCIATNSVPEISSVLSDYFKCNKIKDIHSGYELYKEDIIEYASEEQRNLFTSNFFHQCSSSETLNESKIESLKRLP